MSKKMEEAVDAFVDIGRFSINKGGSLGGSS
jgi:hypothetical protein